MNEAYELIKGVWLLRRAEGSRNSAVIVTPGGSLLVDPGVDAAELEAMDRFVRDEASSVAAVVVTNSRFSPAPGAEWWPDAARLHRLGDPAPLPEGLRGWELVSLRDGNTLALLNRRERVLFAGDMLSDTEVPVLTTGSEMYLEALETVAALEPKLVVPAVGLPATGKRAVRARVERDRNYVVSLVRSTGLSMANGITLEAAERAARITYEDYFFLEDHLINLRSVWNELLGLALDG